MSNIVCKVDACKYDQLSKHTPVFNLNQFEYFLYVYLSPDSCKGLQLFQLDEITKCSRELPVVGNVVRENNCWLKINSNILNKKSGQHLYKLHLIDTVSHEISYLFFSYIIQDDNPDKPYIYMTDACSCKGNN